MQNNFVLDKEVVLISTRAMNVDKEGQENSRLLVLTNHRLIMYPEAFKDKESHPVTFDDIQHITFCSKRHKKFDTFVIVFTKPEYDGDR